MGIRRFYRLLWIHHIKQGWPLALKGRCVQSHTGQHKELWERSWPSIPVRHRSQLRYLDPVFCKGRQCCKHHDLLLRQRIGTRRTARYCHKARNQQQKSLDDVMRTLYNTYYKQKKRGFTDDEFRKACELTAGKALPEIFSYASTTKDVDYKNTLAGRAWALTPARPLGSLSTGATMQLKNNQLVITAVGWNSPAWNTGLSSNDIVLKAAGFNRQTCRSRSSKGKNRRYARTRS